MSLELVIAATLMCAMLYIPGYLALRTAGINRWLSVCCAPLAGITLIAILGQVYAWANITSTPTTIFAPLLVVLGVSALVVTRLSHTKPQPHLEPKVVLSTLLCVVLGLFLMYDLFLKIIPESDYLLQLYDITQHLNIVRAMADAGRLSSIDTSYYAVEADLAIAPVTTSTSFYPAAWHCVCALVVQATGYSVPLVINASMCVFGGVVFPISMMTFISKVFDRGVVALVAGAIATVSFVTFPWLLMVFGPVYPNFCGFCVMPEALVLFASIIDVDKTARERIRLSCTLVVLCLGLTLLHPNILFSCAVILAPLCVTRIWGAPALMERPMRVRLAWCACFVAFCCVVWFGCYKLPFLQETVQHEWAPFARPWQEITNILTLSYWFGYFVTEFASQIPLAALVIIGGVHALHTPGKRWMTVSYLIACLICFVAATRDDMIQHLLAGFWYTDTMRTATLATIAAIPLAVFGMEWVFDEVVDLTRTLNERHGRHTSPAKIGVVCVIGFFLVTFMPEFSLAGLHHEYTAAELVFNQNLDQRDWAKSVHTTYGDYRDFVYYIFRTEIPLDDPEYKFLNLVKTLTEDDLVVNDPLDGSFLAYGSDGVRVYYRTFLGFGSESETKESQIIRTRLSNIATDEEVLEAVRSIGAKYVLILSQEGSSGSFLSLREDVDFSDTEGISTINERTEGFTLVARNGTRRLYRIDAMFED